jgi:hypothetical protein
MLVHFRPVGVAPFDFDIRDLAAVNQETQIEPTRRSLVAAGNRIFTSYFECTIASKLGSRSLTDA